MSLSELELLELIHSKSNRLNLLKYSKFTFKEPDLFQIWIDGIICRKFAYCMKCEILLKLYSCNNGNLTRHCRSSKHSVSNIAKQSKRNKQIFPEQLRNSFKEENNVYDMPFSKGELLELIRSRSERITFFKKFKVCCNNPELFQIRLDGFLCRKYVYCMKCEILLKKHTGSTTDLNRHCRTLNHLKIPCQEEYIDFSRFNKKDSSILNNLCLDGNWF